MKMSRRSSRSLVSSVVLVLALALVLNEQSVEASGGLGLGNLLGGVGDTVGQLTNSIMGGNAVGGVLNTVPNVLNTANSMVGGITRPVMGMLGSITGGITGNPQQASADAAAAAVAAGASGSGDAVSGAASGGGLLGGLFGGGGQHAAAMAQQQQQAMDSAAVAASAGSNYGLRQNFKREAIASNLLNGAGLAGGLGGLGSTVGNVASAALGGVGNTLNGVGSTVGNILNPLAGGHPMFQQQQQAASAAANVAGAMGAASAAGALGAAEELGAAAAGPLGLAGPFGPVAAAANAAGNVIQNVASASNAAAAVGSALAANQGAAAATAAAAASNLAGANVAANVAANAAAAQHVIGRQALAASAIQNAQAEAAIAGADMAAHGANNARSASLASNAYRQAKLASARDRVNIAGTIQNSARISDAAIATHDAATKAEDSLLGSELAVDSAATVLDSDAAYIPPVTNSLLRSLPYGRLGLRNILPKPLTYPSVLLPDVWLNGVPVQYLNAPLRMLPYGIGSTQATNPLWQSGANLAHGNLINGQPFISNNGRILNGLVFDPALAYTGAYINGPLGSSVLPILANGQIEAQDEVGLANQVTMQQLNGAGMGATYTGYGRNNPVPMITGSVSDVNLQPTTTIGTTYPIGSALVIEPRDSYFQDYVDNASSRQNFDEKQQ